MAYTNFTNCTRQEYTDIIYSQDDRNRIRIWFNNVELEDAGEYCESLTGTSTVMSNDGSKRFSIGNFISREYSLILRDLPVGTTIADQVKISIGTLVDSANDTWEDVPIGVFNIQDSPETDKNKVTIKLRDNRVKFDFGYNAKPLIDNNGGSATLAQILSDICTKAGVTSDVSSFNGSSIAVGIYDNTVKATVYVAYIAEQAGAIPVITREGHLDFIYVNNLTTWRIPLSIVEKYEIGTPYQIKRVVYESGTIKYETSNDDTLETLYLDGANVYITSQAQIDAIFDIVEDFEIDSVTTGKILGNPAIDPYDLIEVYDDEDENEPTIFKTLAGNTYTFNGVHRHQFDTQIGVEERTENVSISGEGVFKKIVKTEIDNMNGTITSVVQTVATVAGGYILTTDTTYQEGTTYYSLVDGDYVELIEGTDYDIGDPITGDVYVYEETLQNQINNLNDTLNGTDDTEGVLTTLENVRSELQEVHSTMLTQTSEEFIMSFVQGYINNAFNEVNDLAQANNEALTGQERYIRFVAGNIELGEKDSEVKLLLQKDRVSFMTGENESAYISNNQLYITDSTILNKLQVGHWEIKEDAEHNLNKRWIGGVI